MSDGDSSYYYIRENINIYLITAFVGLMAYLWSSNENNNLIKLSLSLVEK